MFRRLTLAVLMIVCGALAGMVLTGRMRSTEESAAQPAPTRTEAQTPPSATAPRAASPAALPDFADVAARTVSSVVNISSVQVVRQQVSPFANDPFFRQFFGDDDMFGYRERPLQSAGSGVVVSADGYVLTNNHVVGENPRELTVILGDKRERPAKLVGIDPITDLAVLRISATGLTAVTWGDSSQLRVAEWVLAIGNPYQLSQTVTLGIVSALGRQNVTGGFEDDFIQTDAAINPGNSGGALINKRGELIGINTAIFTQTGGYQGIGFAVPSNLARRVLTDITKYGEVRRGSIGLVVTVAVTPELAQELGLKSTKGALVYRMSRSASAWDAGIRPGDVIETFNGHAVDDQNQFLRMLAESTIGSTATIGVTRAGKRFEVKVPIEKATSDRRRL